MRSIFLIFIILTSTVNLGVAQTASTEQKTNYFVKICDRVQIVKRSDCSDYLAATIEGYWQGAFEALLLTNKGASDDSLFAYIDNKILLFCMPEYLSYEGAAQTISDFIKSKKDLVELPSNQAILEAMRAIYPCKKS